MDFSNHMFIYGETLFTAFIHVGAADELRDLNNILCYSKCVSIAVRLRAKFWPDCAIPDTSMKFGTVVDHD